MKCGRGSKTQRSRASTKSFWICGAYGRGPVSEALAIARLFISSGNLATLKGQTVSTQTFAAEPSKVVWKGPVSILIDGTTSGAAEVLASAIVGSHRGDVVGETNLWTGFRAKVDHD